MKLAKRDIALIMIVVGALIVFLAWKFSFSEAQEQVKAEDSKQADLQQQIDAVKDRKKDAQKMTKAMKQWQTDIATILEGYNIAYTYEDGIVYMKQLEEQSFTFLTDNFTCDQTTLDNVIVGQGDFAGKTYYHSPVPYTFEYQVNSYDNLKTMIDYLIDNTNGKMSLDTITVQESTDTPGVYEGNVNMTAYSLSDDPTAVAEYLLYGPVDKVPDVAQGVQNPIKPQQ